MMIRLVAILFLLTSAGVTSACAADADPPTPTPAPTGAHEFPDMSSYTAENPDDYKIQYETPGRPNAKTTVYNFVTPDGIRCSFGSASGAGSGAGCTGNNFPAVPPLECDPSRRMYEVNAIDTNRNLWQATDASCDKAPTGKTLPPLHTLTVHGVTCGVDDARTTACKDPEGRGFVLSPSWSGWLPHV